MSQLLPLMDWEMLSSSLGNSMWMRVMNEPDISLLQLNNLLRYDAIEHSRAADFASFIEALCLDLS